MGRRDACHGSTDGGEAQTAQACLMTPCGARRARRLPRAAARPIDRRGGRHSRSLLDGVRPHRRAYGSGQTSSKTRNKSYNKLKTLSMTLLSKTISCQGRESVLFLFFTILKETTIFSVPSKPLCRRLQPGATRGAPGDGRARRANLGLLDRGRAGRRHPGGDAHRARKPWKQGKDFPDAHSCATL
jgi:hypothetical protein